MENLETLTDNEIGKSLRLLFYIGFVVIAIWYLRKINENKKNNK